MALKVAINGFGRIGRLVFRELINRKADVEFIGINDLTNAQTLAHLFKYDSVHGKFKGEISVEGNNLVVNGKAIPVSAEKEINSIPWKNVDIVIESTGVFTKRDALMKHIETSGAKKVVLTAPAKEALDATVVLGVNNFVLKG
ncbi:MAG: glyceraldehyde 3-phosphate dehydrogenase NAD-binding domain-containing protein, partial [Candidatus Kapaibacterium sp.]